MIVSLIAAITLNGILGPASFSSPQDRHFLESMRDQTDASLLGAGTLRFGNPQMKGSDPKHFAKRLRSIITLSGNIPVKGKKMFHTGPKPMIFTSREQCEPLAQKTGSAAEVFDIPSHAAGLSIAHALKILKDKGAESILIEGGGKLNHACLAQEIIDQIWVTIVPLITIDKNLPFLVQGPEIPLTRLELISIDKGTFGELFAKYHVKKRSL